MPIPDIPSQVLNEVYQALADRHETDIAKLDRAKVSEEEFMAALAFTQGAPLIEANDINESLLTCCQALSRDLDLDALMDYKFVPLANRGQTLVAISTSPWDAMTTEIISSYFPHCSRVRFVLISPKSMTEVFNRLKGANPHDAQVAGYTPKPRPAIPQPPAPVQQPSVPTAGQPAGTPTDQTIPTSVPTPTTPASVGQEMPSQSLLTSEEATCLVNILVQEANRLLQRRQRKSL